MAKFRKILIYHIGQLGDTLISIPAIWAVRQNFPDAVFTMMYDFHGSDSGYVTVKDVLEGSGAIDDFIEYEISDLKRPLAFFKNTFDLIRRLRSRKYEAVIYLVRSGRNKLQINRDKLFFRLSGIKHFFGFKGFQHLFERANKKLDTRIPSEAQMLLERLGESGIKVPSSNNGRVDVNIQSDERLSISKWIDGLPFDGDRSWIALGVGSKMPVKVWPIERYKEVVSKLIDKFDVWPVIFGGYEDRKIGEELVSQWGCGYAAAGKLGIRNSIAAMEKCMFYLGNDTGTMHMAASAGLKCAAVFSSRDYPGRWEPYTEGHIILRTHIPCEGCMHTDSTNCNKECILSISVEDVFDACCRLVSQINHTT